MRAWISAWAAVAAALAAMGPAVAEPVDVSARRTVVILCEDLEATDLRDPSLPALRRLARDGCLGLLAMPPSRATSPETAVLSLATGGPAVGAPEDRAAFRADESVEDSTPEAVLERRTGWRVGPDRDKGIIHLGIASLARRGYLERLVAVRAAQSGSGARIAADIPRGLPPGDSRRLSALFAVGRDGFVPASDGQAAVTIANVGADRLELEQRITHAGQAEQSICVVGYRAAVATRDTYLMRPTAIVLGWPGSRSALLTSATTRTAGLISYVDIAPTLLRWLGGEPDARDAGHAIEMTPCDTHLATIADLDRTMATNAAALVPVLLAFGAFAGVTMLLALVSLRICFGARKVARAFCYGAMPLPLAFLASGPITWAASGPVSPQALGLLIALVSAAIALPCWLWARRHRAGVGVGMVSAVTLLVVVVILVDAWTGQTLIRNSVLAAAGRAGARFYGIGNEYMAFLVASATGLTLVGPLRRPACAICLAIVVLSLGLGGVGANAGGVITSVSAFFVVVVLLRGKRPTWRTALGGFVMGVLTAIAFAALDRALAGIGASHLGAAIHRAGAAGPSPLVDMAVRKLSLSVQSATSVHGIVALLAGAAIFLAAYLWLRSDIAQLAAAHPGWWQWRQPALTGALVGLVANDTGIVPMLIIFGVFVYIGLVLRLSMPPDHAPSPP